jgi:putative transposase
VVGTASGGSSDRPPTRCSTRVPSPTGVRPRPHDHCGSASWPSSLNCTLRVLNTLITLQRQRLRYQRNGLLGVVDGRYSSRRPVLGKIDERIVAVLRRLLDEEIEMSTGTMTRLRRRVDKALVAEYGLAEAPKMPSRATFYRLVNRLAQGRHTFGSAWTRRSLAKQPDGPFGALTVARPGEMVEIDAAPFDVRVVLDDGIVDRVELTAIVDNATRSIPGAVLRPTTKAVDASLRPPGAARGRPPWVAASPGIWRCRVVTWPASMISVPITVTRTAMISSSVCAA